MHAFEQIVAEILERAGYWVQASVKVEITAEAKRAIGKPAMPRPELDLVAYHPGSNTLAIVECKSFFDSLGVTAAQVMRVGATDGRYKLFTHTMYRNEITKALVNEYVGKGRCAPKPKVEFWLVCGKIKASDTADLSEYFRQERPEKWRLFDRDWLAARLNEAADNKYENLVSTMVAKILKPAIIKRARKRKQ